MRQYLELVQDVLDNGVEVKDRTGVGALAVSGRTLRFKMSDGFPLVTTKKVPLRLPLEEMFFFIKGGSNNNDLLEKNVTIWNEWAHPETGDLGRLYGVQWRDWTSPVTRKFNEFQDKYGDENFQNLLMGNTVELNEYEKASIRGVDMVERSLSYDLHVDQIKKVQWQLKNEPTSRRIIVNAWNPGELDLMALPPCHFRHQLIVLNNKLNMTVSIRSNDLMLGAPFNIAQYAALLHMYAVVSKYEANELTIFIDIPHIYLNHIEGAKEQLKREPRTHPTLWVNPDVKSVEEFTIEDFRLEGYGPYPHIKFDVAV